MKRRLRVVYLTALLLVALILSIPSASSWAATKPQVQSRSPASVTEKAPPQDSIRFGVARMKDDPRSRTVMGLDAVGDMTYHGGLVQHTQTVFTVFWVPSGFSIPGGYQTTIDQFVQDLNGSAYYGIASQYSDTTGNISTTVLYGGTWLDTTNAFPSNTLSYSNLLAEINRAKVANGWTSDANSYFQVYTPSGIGTTLGANFCGLHWFANPAIGQILFPQSGCFPGSPYPNNQVADSAINTSAHEIMETVTDPLGNAWFFTDSSGEIGDLCNFIFGSRAADGSNVTLNGHPYIIQQEWSNLGNGCRLSLPASPPLRIDTIAPPAGRTSGGQQIILRGAFAGLSTVTMGGAAASFVYTNGPSDTTSITVTTPAHAVGAVQIDLTPMSGSVVSKANAFAYLPTVFTDDTILVGQTTAKAQHILELRQAVDAMRAVAGLGGAPWTDPALAAGDTIKATHILDLRTFLDDAATRLGYSTSAYTDPSLAAGFMIKRIHIEELRQRIRTIAG